MFLLLNSNISFHPQPQGCFPFGGQSCCPINCCTWGGSALYTPGFITVESDKAFDVDFWNSAKCFLKNDLAWKPYAGHISFKGKGRTVIRSDSSGRLSTNMQRRVQCGPRGAGLDCSRRNKCRELWFAALVPSCPLSHSVNSDKYSCLPPQNTKTSVRDNYMNK